MSKDSSATFADTICETIAWSTFFCYSFVDSRRSQALPVSAERSGVGDESHHCHLLETLVLLSAQCPFLWRGSKGGDCS